MEWNWKRGWTLFAATFGLSAFTFGGGYVIIPLMRRKFVDELKWLDEEEMLNMAAIAQSAPGPIAVNAAMLLGLRLMGWPGALIAVIGTVLPPLIILSVVSMFYVAFRENKVVNAVLRGMMPGVCAVIFDVVANMGGAILRNKRWLPIAILCGAFVANYVLHINAVYTILCCAALGALAGVHDRRTGKGR